MISYFPSLGAFQFWLRKSGYDYLDDGVAFMPVGDALMEIARRAGVRGLRGEDSILETLPMIARLIELRCKPRL